MNLLIQQIIAQSIIKKAFISNYPKPGVVFLAIDPLFNDPAVRKIISKLVALSTHSLSFDAVAGIASRGYLFSGMIANQLTGKGEYLVQKVKSIGDSRYVQLNATTEYSSDALQVLKNTIQPGKKYLLTDDLIATGGSVETAIKLIRQCGGQVDTVFVMTELTDFNARNGLKKQGVELVSLLKFSQNDLNKLLSLQKSYAQSPSTPITYKFTNHSQGVEELIQSNHSNSVIAHLASISPIKLEAIQSAFQGMFDPLRIQITGHQVDSEVNAQPFGYTETINGATNRLKLLEQITKNSEQKVLVSMENGIRYSEEDKSYYDFVHVIVQKDNNIYSHTQDCCKIPEHIIHSMPRAKNQAFLETWGETAKRMGLIKQSDNPHQEIAFGGISRTDHLFQALCQALGKYKENMMEQYPIKMEDQKFNINRLVELNGKKPINKYAKQGIFFTPSQEVISKPINFYNHGCPIKQWNIDPEKVARNSFQVFSTGDAFSVISPDIEISGTHINIHVGTKHPSHSPLTLLQEALQLCRCAYEHGARSITIALPDHFHPVAHFSDFNSLLLSLFKVSGANKVYFYDKNYTGKLDETNLKDTLSLTLSNHSDTDHYYIDRKELSAYLKNSENNISQLGIDDQIVHYTRTHRFERDLSKFSPEAFNANDSLFELKVPESKIQPHILLCCSANKSLAKKIAASLRMRGEMVRLYSIDGKGEQAKIPSEVTICGAEVTIIQSTRPNPDCTEEASEYKNNGASSYLFEAALIARQAHLRGAKTINLINPYQFSARSDKAEDNFKGKTGAYVQQIGMLLAAAGVNHVITAECHDTHTMTGSFTGKKIRGSAVSAISLISTKLAKEWINDPDHPIQGQLRLVTPDAGAAKRTKELTELLQSILGNKLSQTRVLGDKQRDSHKDDSALISSLNSGTIGINANDKYLITDDETATGTTLCQAVENLSKNGAKNIAVVVVHNNMPLDWLTRQLCLARFFYLGVTELHFSDTNEMASLAKSYDDLIVSSVQRAKLSAEEVEARVFKWFKENIGGNISDNSSEVNLKQEFTRFKSMFNQFEKGIRVHSLANEFANKVTTKPYIVNPHAFEYKVNELIKKIRGSNANCIVSFAGTSLAAASAVALELDLPLLIIPQIIPGTANQKLVLPKNTFALIGTPNEMTLKTLAKDTGYSEESLLPTGSQDTDGELVIVFNKSSSGVNNVQVNENNSSNLDMNIRESLAMIEELCNKIKNDSKLKERPVKLLGIGNEGQILAGQLGHLLNKMGYSIGIAAVDHNLNGTSSSVIYTGKSENETLSVDRNSLGMGDVCIAVAGHITSELTKAINNLVVSAKVHCPYSLSGSIQRISSHKEEVQGIYSAKSKITLFSQSNDYQAKQMLVHDSNQVSI